MPNIYRTNFNSMMPYKTNQVLQRSPMFYNTQRPYTVFGQTLPKTNFSQEIEKLSIGESSRIGQIRPKLLASMIATKEIDSTLISKALVTPSKEGKMHLTTKEFAETILSDLMLLSEAGKILSSETIGTKLAVDTLKSLYIYSPERFTELIKRPEMDKLKIAIAMYSEKNQNKNKTMTEIMKDVLKNKISPYYALTLLDTYLNKKDFPEIFSSIEKKIRKEIESFNTNQETLSKMIKEFSQIANKEDKQNEIKNKLLQDIINLTEKMTPDEIAQVIRNPKYFSVSRLILENNLIKLDKKASIIASKHFHLDEISHLASMLDSKTLSEILVKKDKNGKYIVSDEIFAAILKDRHFSLRKALEILQSTAFLERINSFAYNKSLINDVLLNTLLYYFPIDEAINVIKANGRDVEQLMSLLPYMFHPELDSPCVP